MTDASSNLDPYTRVDVSEWVEVGIEQSGSSPGRWLEDPSDSETRWFHKDTVIPKHGYEQGEDWAEVVSTQVARLLGVPCAPTRLCARNARRGSLSQNIRPDGVDLNEGGVVLERCLDVKSYIPHRDGVAGVDPARPRVKRPGHTLENIEAALREVAAPVEFEGPATLDGFDVFVGYLILDALIANQDRHEQNWAVLTPQLTNQPERLAPSYDHASSLGFNLLDERRASYLSAPDGVVGWARKGRAGRFENDGEPETLVDFAVGALARRGAEAQRYWIHRVAGLDLSSVHRTLASGGVPGMSDAASRFADALLSYNEKRIRDAIAHVG